MPDRVFERDLPARVGFFKVGKVLDDPVVDHLQRHFGVLGLFHREDDQLRVGVGRFACRVGAKLFTLLQIGCAVIAVG